MLQKIFICIENACRYRFPRKCEEKSTIDIDEDGNATVRPKRTVKSEYINSYSEMLILIFRSNHDVRSVLCSCIETYYALAYSVNSQNSIDNIAAASLAALTKESRKRKT